MYEENPTSLYSEVHIVNNPIPISSNITESQGKDPLCFILQEMLLWNQLLVLMEKLPILQALFEK